MALTDDAKRAMDEAFAIVKEDKLYARLAALGKRETPPTPGPTPPAPTPPAPPTPPGPTPPPPRPEDPPTPPTPPRKSAWWGELVDD